MAVSGPLLFKRVSSLPQMESELIREASAADYRANGSGVCTCWRWAKRC